MGEFNKKLNVVNRGIKSDFFAKATERIKHKKWLGYSSQIARRVAATIENDEELNQTKLAKQLGVTPQQISKILKGHENLTLETISNLSEALEVELIAFPEYKYSRSSKKDFKVIGNDINFNSINNATLYSAKIIQLKVADHDYKEAK